MSKNLSQASGPSVFLGVAWPWSMSLLQQSDLMLLCTTIGKNRMLHKPITAIFASVNVLTLGLPSRSPGSMHLLAIGSGCEHHALSSRSEYPTAVLQDVLPVARTKTVPNVPQVAT